VKNQISLLRADINAALKAVAEKHGMAKIETTSCKFMDDSCIFKLEVVKAGGLSKEAKSYDMMRKTASFSGLPPLGTIISIKKSLYQIDGLNSTGTKVIATDRINGKQYLLPTQVVINESERCNLNHPN
jgi:hypothetical protein